MLGVVRLLLCLLITAAPLVAQDSAEPRNNASYVPDDDEAGVRELQVEQVQRGVRLQLADGPAVVQASRATGRGRQRARPDGSPALILLPNR